MRHSWFTLFYAALLPFTVYSHTKPSGKRVSLSKADIEKKKSMPVVLMADSVSYDKRLDVVVAEGDVVILQDGQSVFADKAIYNEKAGEIIADGRVFLQDYNANIAFANHVNLSKDLERGVVVNPMVITSKRERVTAKVATKNGDNQRFTSASYTPCERCRDSRSRPPVWSIHADKIDVDNKNNMIEYENAEIDLLGIPVGYSPYICCPIRRKSGFLFPKASIYKTTGFFAATPYYFAINKSTELKVTPYAFAKAGAMLSEKFKHKFNDGEVSISGAVAQYKNEYFLRGTKVLKKRAISKARAARVPATRGYGEMKSFLPINDNFSLNIYEIAASDPTFFRARPFFGKRNASFLESNSSIDGYFVTPRSFENHYVRVESLHYQSLSAHDTLYKQSHESSPVILPSVNYTYVSPALLWGSRAMVDVGALSLARKFGNNMQRASVQLSWTMDAIAPGGQLFTPFVHIREDVYHNKQNRIKNELHSLYFKNKRPDSRAKTAKALVCEKSETPSSETYFYDDIEDVFDEQQQSDQLLFSQKYKPMRKISTNKKFKNSANRMFPQAGVGWKMPFFVDELGGITISPVAQIVTSTTKKDSIKIQNEDSLGVDFTDGQVLQENRFPGKDRLDYGSRCNYGIDISRRICSSTVAAFLGQSYSFSKPPEIMKSIGIEKGFSNVVGNARADLFDGFVDVIYRFRVNNKHLSPMYQEATFSLGPSELRAHGTYTFLNRPATTDKKQKRFEQLSFALSSSFAEFWSASAGCILDLNGMRRHTSLEKVDKIMPIRKKKEGRYHRHDNTLSKFVSISYNDECFSAGISLKHSIFKSRDVRPGMTVLFSVVFKGLGGVKQSVNSGIGK